MYIESTGPSPKSKSGLVLFFGIFLLPPTFLSLGILSPWWHYPILAVMVLTLTIYCLFRLYIIPKRKFIWKSFKSVILPLWGFRNDTLAKSFKWNMLFTGAAVFFMFIGSQCGWFEKTTAPAENVPAFYFFYNFISVPFQVFFFLGIVIAEMKYMKVGNFWIVVVSSLNFSYLHIFWMSMQTEAATLIAGIVWGLIYVKHPNFCVAVMSHAILGAAAIEFGVI